MELKVCTATLKKQHPFEEIFDRLKCLLMIKILNNLGVIEKFLNLIKMICENPKVNVTLTIERLNP